MTGFVDEVVACSNEQDVFVDAGHLFGLTDSPEQVLIGLGFPVPETWACPGAASATLLAVDAILGAEFVFEVEWFVVAWFVFVANDVVRAGNNAAGAASAQPAVDDLVVEFFPLVGPSDTCWLGGLSCAHAQILNGQPTRRLDERRFTAPLGSGR